MAVGKRIYLKRHMPDKEVMMQFKNIPASNTCDVMGRNAAMNPRIRLVSQPKEQMAVGPALTVKARGGDNLALHAALNIAQEGDFIVVSNEEDDSYQLLPAWYYLAEGSEESKPYYFPSAYVIINAIDGSIYNNELGYIYQHRNKSD